MYRYECLVYFYWYSALGPVWAETSQDTGMALDKFLGVACHCFPRFLHVPTFHHQVPPRPPRRERSQRRKWELWARMLSGISAEMTTSTPFRDLLHPANLRHGTGSFTSPPKEGVLRISFTLKNPTASTGFEPANFGTKGQHATPRPPKPSMFVYERKNKVGNLRKFVVI